MVDDEFFRRWETGFVAHQNGLRPGSEFDWFAVDSKGQIACFLTAGFGLVPELVFRDKVMHWKLDNYFYREPEDYAFIQKNSCHWEYDVSQYAQRGLYSYDNPSDMKKPYELAARPETPFNISDLPPEFNKWLTPLTFKHLDFADSPKINVGKYFVCI